MSDNYDRILDGLGVITTTTPATTAHACTLAGGIRASLDPAVFGWTLTIADELRALTLTLLPEQVAEMATWEVEHWGNDFSPAAMRLTNAIHDDVGTFCHTTRARLRWVSTSQLLAKHDDIVSLRGLAAAAQGEGDR